MQRLRTFAPEIDIAEAQIVLTVAQRPGILQSELTREMGSKQSRISRQLAILFEEHGYISINKVPTNRRCNELHLTEKGEALVAALTHR